MSDMLLSSLIINGDCEGNLEEIAKVLNGFVFASDDGQDERFAVHKGRIVSNRTGLHGVAGANCPGGAISR